MPAFYVMECFGHPPISPVNLTSDVAESPWMTGRPVAAPVGAVEYAIDAAYPGTLKALYVGLGVPLMRKDIAAALASVGVDNLQLFDAIVRDEKQRTSVTNYVAFNVIGLVAGADMKLSELMHGDSITGIDHDFASLHFDEERLPKDLLCFRLAESVNAIVVHERVKQAVEDAGIEGMMFFGSGEWSG